MEDLQFTEYRHKPTANGANYCPYEIKAIRIKSYDELEVTCISAEVTNEVVSGIEALVAEKKAKIHTLTPTSFDEILLNKDASTFTLVAEVMEFIQEFAQLGYISHELAREIKSHPEVQKLPFYYENENELIVLEEYETIVTRLSQQEFFAEIAKLIEEKTGSVAKIFISEWHPPALLFWVPTEKLLSALSVKLQIKLASGHVRLIGTTHLPLNHPSVKTAMIFHENNFDNIQRLLRRFKEVFTSFFFEAKEASACKPFQPKCRKHI